MIELFRNKANEVDLTCKISQETCARIAKALVKERPAKREDFDRIEYMKDFVLKTSKCNELTLDLLKYITGLLIDIVEDAKVITEGAILRDKLRDSGLTIELYQDRYDKLVKEIYEDKKNEISRGNTQNS